MYNNVHKYNFCQYWVQRVKPLEKPFGSEGGKFLFYFNIIILENLWSINFQINNSNIIVLINVFLKVLFDWI